MLIIWSAFYVLYGCICLYAAFNIRRVFLQHMCQLLTAPSKPWIDTTISPQQF